MKKTFLSVMMLAAAAFTVTSCSESEEFIAGREGKNVKIAASNPEVENDTRTQFGADGITPYWSGDDVIKVIGDVDFTDIYEFTNDSKKPTKTTTFSLSEFVGEYPFANEKTLFAFHGYFRSYNPEGDFKVKNHPMINNQDVKKNQFDSNADILISKPFAAASFDDYEPVNLQFKRLTGLLKIRLIDMTGAQSSKGKAVTEISISTNEKNNNFCGTLEGNIHTGEFTKVAGDLQEAKASVKGYTVCAANNAETDNNAIYLSVLPTTFKEGESIYLKATVGGQLFEKTLKVPAGGIEIPASTVTTFNVTMEDVAAGQPTVSGHTIQMNALGTLTTDFINGVISSQTSGTKRIAVKGDMNASDFDAILNAASSKAFELDLTDANFIADNSTFKGNNKFSADFTVEDNMFSGDYQFEKIKLPKSTVYVGNYAFNNLTNLTELVIPHNVKYIGTGILTGCSDQTIELVILSGIECTIEEGFVDDGSLSDVNLTINDEWSSEVNSDSIYWKGILFSTVYTVTVNPDGTYY